MKLLLEGRPGVGKTTVARRVVELLREAGVPARGFFTEELRESGARVGFAIETIGGPRGVLAHVNFPGPPRVGRYGVDVAAFERLALPALQAAADEVVVIDELGKMELASEAFRAAVLRLFERQPRIVATVHVFRHPFTDALRRRADVVVLRVTERERAELPVRVVERVTSPGR